VSTTPINSTATDFTQVIFTGLAHGTTCYFVVRAANKNGRRSVERTLGDDKSTRLSTFAGATNGQISPCKLSNDVAQSIVVATTATLASMTLRYSGLCIAGWSSLVARRAHNPKVASSNLAPATKIEDPGSAWVFVPSGTDCGEQSAEIGSRRPHGYYATSLTSWMAI
jgi:hypothetical protein